MKILAILLLFAVQAFAQSVTIQPNTLTFSATINGTVVNLVGPATAVTIPVVLPSATSAGQVLTSTGSGTSYTAQTPMTGSTLPAGITYANNVFTVSGSISTGSLSLTNGPALPTCASNLFLWQLVSGVLQPACYTLPPITVSQATSPNNTITLTP